MDCRSETSESGAAASAKKALAWMESLVVELDKGVLFRGQRRVYPTVLPSIARDCEPTRQRFRGITRLFCSSQTMHLTGYRIEKVHDRLSILQHYIGRSPVIDLTGDPRIALYFALLGDSTENRVVYAIDVKRAAKSGVVFSNHAFFALPLGSGGETHRWVLQDGYSVGPTDWENAEEVENFDLLKLDGVSSLHFKKGTEDDRLVEHLGNLESTENDPLALKVRGNVQGLARFLGVLTPSVEAILSASSTVDPDDVLRQEIDELVTLAERQGDQGAIRELRELKTYVGRRYWDTGFDVALWSIGRKLRRSTTS